jgi:hypothetical protein
MGDRLWVVPSPYAADGPRLAPPAPLFGPIVTAA